MNGEEYIRDKRPARELCDRELLIRVDERVLGLLHSMPKLKARIRVLEFTVVGLLVATAPEWGAKLLSLVAR